MENHEADQQAKRRVEARLGFYWHLGPCLRPPGHFQSRYIDRVLMVQIASPGMGNRRLFPRHWSLPFLLRQVSGHEGTDDRGGDEKGIVSARQITNKPERTVP